jgi:arabinofuranosyltransferase
VYKILHSNNDTSPRQSIAAIALWLSIFTCLSIGIYLFFSYITYRIGYPLDDAWIHQTYARNLVNYHEWSITPASPSAGSTAPLWSVLLAAGYLLNIPHHIWTFTLGSLALLTIGIVGESGYHSLTGNTIRCFPIVGCIFIFEWHLVWAALSGMETILFAVVILFTLLLLLKSRKCWIFYGIIIGVSVWIRPDGITLIGPVLGLIFFIYSDWKSRSLAATKVLASALIFLIPYLLFNLNLSGSLFPNTFYAKQSEYQILQHTPFIVRYFNQFSLPMIGTGVLLFPGFIFFMISAIREKHSGKLLALLWYLGYLGIYALKLPVIYQHGRYIIPAMPFFFLIGLVGSLQMIKAINQVIVRRIVKRSWVMSLVALLIIFYFKGAQAYASDVGIIESEMVNTALWVTDNINKDELIAVHDIGAIGYFSERKLIDLAGLITPELINQLNDEKYLKDYLTKSRVKYLIAFKDQYSLITQNAKILYMSNGQFSPMQGGKNMCVYYLTGSESDNPYE